MGNYYSLAGVVATPAKLGFGQDILEFLEIFGIFERKTVILEIVGHSRAFFGNFRIFL